MKTLKNENGFSHLLIFIALLLVSVIAFSGYKVYSAGEEKGYFERLDGRISAISYKALSKFGAAEKVLDQKVCGNTGYGKFDDGTLSCGVTYAYYYKDYLSDGARKEKAAKLEETMAKTLVAHGFEARYPAPGALPYGYGDPESRHGICQITTDFFKSDTAPEDLVWKSVWGVDDTSKPVPEDIRITIHCHAKSRDKYYE